VSVRVWTHTFVCLCVLIVYKWYLFKFPIDYNHMMSTGLMSRPPRGTKGLIVMSPRVLHMAAIELFFVW